MTLTEIALFSGVAANIAVVADTIPKIWQRLGATSLPEVGQLDLMIIRRVLTLVTLFGITVIGWAHPEVVAQIVRHLLAP